MKLGTITGKTTTKEFSFLVEGEVKSFEYVQVPHKEYGFVLAQIAELEKDEEKTVATCIIIGYKDEYGKVKPLRVPFDIGTDVMLAETEFIASMISLGREGGAYIGKLEGKDIKVYLDMQQLLTKHLSVLAKSGAGKSYAVGVLIEELLERNVPLLIIDPHGEYISLREKNDSLKEKERMAAFGVAPKSYKQKIKVYGDSSCNDDCLHLKLSDGFTADELLDILPAKLSQSQLGMVYATIKNLNASSKKPLTLSSLSHEVSLLDSNLKWGILPLLDYLKSLDLFSEVPTPLRELVQLGRCSIINLRGMSPEVQDLVVYKIAKDLFEARKKDSIPPFFLVVEEAHNFCPEKGMGEKKIAGKVLRLIASEGRKFGLGLAVITQRPARIEKSVISQCTTQIILKLTNPNDLKAVSQSVEGITLETEKEIKNLPVGTALVTGIVDIPLLVSIRPKRTKHGGQAVQIFKLDELPQEFIAKTDDMRIKEILPIIQPRITENDAKIMAEPGEKIETVLLPAVLVRCRQGNDEFQLLVEMVGGHVLDPEQKEGKKLPDFTELPKNSVFVLKTLFLSGPLILQGLREKTKLPLKELQSLTDRLLAKGLIMKQDSDTLKLHDSYLFSSLKSAETFEKIEYTSFAHTSKREAAITPEKLRALLSEFVSVLDIRECFIVRYEPLSGEEAS